MQTFIQIIQTQWTKQSRGSPGAQARKHVPEIMRIPDAVPSEAVLHQQIGFSESTAFALARPSPAQVFSADDARKWGISILQHGADAEISFFGVPGSEASGRPLNVARLVPNSWMRIVGNRRVAWESTWAYYQYVYNVFHGDLSKANALMASTPPAHSLNHEGHLW